MLISTFTSTQDKELKFRLYKYFFNAFYFNAAAYFFVFKDEDHFSYITGIIFFCKFHKIDWETIW